MTHINKKPTGKQRYRTSFFGKIILQIQMQGEWQCHNYYHPYYGGNPNHGKIETWWRDATSEDLINKEHPQ